MYDIRAHVGVHHGGVLGSSFTLDGILKDRV